MKTLHFLPLQERIKHPGQSSAALSSAMAVCKVSVSQAATRSRSHYASGFSSACLEVITINMLQCKERVSWGRKGREVKCGTENRTSFVFHLATIIIICSVVINTWGDHCLDPANDGGRQWSSCRQSSSRLCKLWLINRRWKRMRRRKDGERRKWWEEKKGSYINRNSDDSKQSHQHELSALT